MKPIRIQAILVATMDKELGELGLCLEGMRAPDGEVNSATEGSLIAHDLIEHVNGPERIGSIEDELEALGAIWYARGQHNDLSRSGRGSFYSVEENIASDVVRMFRDYWDGGQEFDTRKRYSRPCEDVDDAIDGTLEFAQRDYAEELSESNTPETRSAWRKYKSAARHLMRTGYRKAMRKWEKHGRYAANNAFWEIADAVQPYCKPEFEGQRFELIYCNNRGTSCTELWIDAEE